MTEDLLRTPLYDLHLELGARMVPFAGYHMPVQYPMGVLKEHQHCRAAAGLFDVSHMGQVILRGPDVAIALETLVPQDVLGLGEGRQRYGFFTNNSGGIDDDLMFSNRGDHIYMVVNAACKTDDISRLRAGLEPQGIAVEEITDRALMAIQGPGAEMVLASLNPRVAQLRFMDVATVELLGAECWVSRSGYTGEDGYEISVPVEYSVELARALLAIESCAAIGLGARDSLRLEAGLCLYGHDITKETSPAEAALSWAVQKARKTGGARAGGFPGAKRILQEFASGTTRKRVGLRPRGRAPMREGVILYPDETSNAAIGQITSGGFGPTVGGPVAMGYVLTEKASVGAVLFGDVRGKRLAVEIVEMPFSPANFKR